MASERDLAASLQPIFQIQADAGLEPGMPLSETLDHILRPIFQLDSPPAGQPPSHAAQQVDAGAARVVQETTLSLSRNRTAPVQPSPPDQSAAFTMPGNTYQVHAPPPSSAPASFPSVRSPTNASSQCPVCRQSFRRPQERDRHVRTHLPYWLFCPILGCSWRGDRSYALRTHWAEKHANFGEVSDPNGCKIYDPEPLVQSVVHGRLLIVEATEIALHAVRTRVQALEKVGVWEDEWGRGQRVRY